MWKVTQWKGKLLLTVGYLLVLRLLWSLDLHCIFRTLLHIPCPGCGMSRAFLAALGLDFRTAFAHHPMFWSLPILYLYFLLDHGIFRSRKLNCAVLILIGVGFAINWGANLAEIW